MESRYPHIIIESNIPFIRGVFDRQASVSYLAPDRIDAQALRDADALIIRTRTRCDAALLSGSRCSMIATATIGLDHIDLDYCRWNGIEVANAPGCNAPAVAQYVLSAVIAAYGKENIEGLTLGIVGVGHVGKIVERWARSLGLQILLCDPPRAAAEGADAFTGLDTIVAESDVITIHTPYTISGPDATHHLFNENLLQQLRRRPMLINAARGPIVDNAALCRAIDGGYVSCAVVDCWENEPDISHELLEKAFIATPHIAGYSRQGKIRASQMAADAVARHFNLQLPPPEEVVPMTPPDSVSAAAIAASYNPLADTAALRADSGKFEALRNSYSLRDEVCVDRAAKRKQK